MRVITNPDTNPGHRQYMRDSQNFLVKVREVISKGKEGDKTHAAGSSFCTAVKC